MMKKQKMSFETNSWARCEVKKPSGVIDAFFENDALDNYKQTLGGVMASIRYDTVYNAHNPGAVFAFYMALRSLLRACYDLQSKKTRSNTDAHECRSVLHQASLTKEEFNDPYLVFRNAFADKKLAEFEFFLCEAVELSLSKHTDDGYWDVMAFYIHLVKMLDAAQLLRDRRREKKTISHPANSR